MALSRRPHGSDSYPRPGYRRIAAPALAAALALSAMFLTPWGATAASASTHPRSHSSKSASHRGWVKYYIVRPPKHGHKEFLFEIAARTLGNGNRDQEIFKLNQDRLQPHGARMKSLTVILPGWILVLPKDAHGSGVHFGPLPVVKAEPAHSPSPSASASAPASAGSGAMPSAMPHMPATARGAAQPSMNMSSMDLEMDGGGALIVLLMIALLIILLRLRRKSAAARGPGGGGGPRDPRGPREPRRPGRPAGTPRAAGPVGGALAVGPGRDGRADGGTWPYLMPAEAAAVAGREPAALDSPPLLNVPDSLAGPALPGGPMITAEPPSYDGPDPAGHPGWMSGPAALRSPAQRDVSAASGAPASEGSDGGVLSRPGPGPAGGAGGGGTGTGRPMSIDDTGEFTWPDYLSPGVSQPDTQALGRPARGWREPTADDAKPVTKPEATVPQIAAPMTTAAGPAGPEQRGTQAVGSEYQTAAHSTAAHSTAAHSTASPPEDSAQQPPWDPAPVLAVPVDTGSEGREPANAASGDAAPPRREASRASLPDLDLGSPPPPLSASPEPENPWTASPAPSVTEPLFAEPAPQWPDSPRPRSGPALADAPAGETPAVGLSPVALRILGAQRSSAQLAETADMPVQRHEVALGDDRVQVVLAQAPAVSHDGKSRNSHTWLTSTPYLVWSPLPYDTPDDGIAFACLGAGDEGCLFIDLAAAPGAVAIGGGGGAPVRLAESVAHQLCLGAAADRGCVVIVIGDALPEPHPVGAAWIPSLRELGSALLPIGPDDGAEVVFCQLNSNEDAFALARYVSSAQRRVVPIVLADLPDAPWSFTTQPARHPNEVLHPVTA